MTEEQFLKALEPNKSDTLKKGAWERLMEIGPPSKLEAFQYVPLRAFYTHSFAPSSLQKVDVTSHVYKECRNACLVFVDGHFSKELSDISGLPSQCVVLDLNEAAFSFSAYLQNRHRQLQVNEKDPFALINTCHHKSGAFVYLPAKVVSPIPLQILSFVTKGVQCYPRVHLFLGAHSQLRLIAKTIGEESFLNDFIDIALDEGAKMDYFAAFKSSSWHFSSLRAQLKRDSHLNVVSLVKGSKMTRQSIQVTLNKENSEALVRGISLLDATHQSHTHILLEHKAPHTRSQQLFKNVLNDLSRSSFEGKIFVERIAQKTAAYQMNRNLLLSEGAIAYSKPNLEIFADDVKASHGATVSPLNQEELIYLKSRGLLQEDAQKLLLLGFCKEVIDYFPKELSLYSEMMEMLKSYPHSKI